MVNSFFWNMPSSSVSHKLLHFKIKIPKQLWLLSGYQWWAKSNQNDAHVSAKASRILLNEIENLPLYLNSASDLIFQILQPSTMFWWYFLFCPILTTRKHDQSKSWRRVTRQWCHVSGNTKWWREILQINLKAPSYFSWSALKLRLCPYLKFCFDPVPFYVIIAITWQEFLADSKVVQHLYSILFYPHVQAASQRRRFGVFFGHLQQVRQHVHAHHRWLWKHVGLVLLIQTGTPGRNE